MLSNSGHPHQSHYGGPNPTYPDYPNFYSPASPGGLAAMFIQPGSPQLFGEELYSPIVSTSSVSNHVPMPSSHMSNPADFLTFTDATSAYYTPSPLSSAGKGVEGPDQDVGLPLAVDCAGQDGDSASLEVVANGKVYTHNISDNTPTPTSTLPRDMDPQPPQPMSSASVSLRPSLAEHNHKSNNNNNNNNINGNGDGNKSDHSGHRVGDYPPMPTSAAITPTATTMTSTALAPVGRRDEERSERAMLEDGHTNHRTTETTQSSGNGGQATGQPARTTGEWNSSPQDSWARRTP